MCGYIPLARGLTQALKVQLAPTALTVGEVGGVDGADGAGEAGGVDGAGGAGGAGGVGGAPLGDRNLQEGVVEEKKNEVEKNNFIEREEITEKKKIHIAPVISEDSLKESLGWT